ncbi:MAG TPA: exodeoxyribonuclease VII large subunit [Clostridia bacterium]
MKYILSVSDTNKYIKQLISGDPILSGLYVRGEISNLKCHHSGHIYFTVKDESSLLKCVMFRSSAISLRFSPENGMKVIMRGYVSIFERDGQYQLYVEDMQPDGTGALHMAFEQLKKKLEAEGLFDARHKKEIPYLPKSICVVTSATGAVIRDIINVLDRRFGSYNLKLYPVAVQGELAARQIARAVKKINEAGCADVIILARGGGSLEELWAFNEEVVARSVFNSDIPVISAIGHETDFTITDFVADLRAPTPSAAAEMVLPEKSLLYRRIDNIRTRLLGSIRKMVGIKRKSYEMLKNSRVLKHPYERIYQERMRIDLLNKYMIKSVRANIADSKSTLAVLIGKLDVLSPLTVLARGYGIVRKDSADIIKSVDVLNDGDRLEIKLVDGKVFCTVNSIEKEQ